MIRLYMYNPP